MVVFNIKDIAINRKQLIKILIVVFLLLAVVIVVYRNHGRGNLDIVSDLNAMKKLPKEADHYFDIKILDSAKNISINSKRDLFRFYQEPPKVVQPPPQPPPPPVERVEVKTEEQIAQEMQMQEPPAMMSLKLFGILNRSDKQIYAFISDGKEIYVVTKDNIFANQFKVTYIDEEKIEIMALKNKYKKTLVFIGGKQT
jgi:hypothetical protein